MTKKNKQIDWKTIGLNFDLEVQKHELNNLQDFVDSDDDFKLETPDYVVTKTWNKHKTLEIIGFIFATGCEIKYTFDKDNLISVDSKNLPQQLNFF